MAESWTLPELLNAGWAQADVDWERIAAEAFDACASGDVEAARQKFGACVQLAREHFETSDPRLGTSLANYGACRKLTGDAVAAELLDEAKRVWQSCDPWIDAMTAPRSARSSMFHMRMEQRHRDAYEDRWRIKWRELRDQARETVANLAGADGLPEASAREALGQWRRECPAMLNDSRKLMAAVILLLKPD